MPVLDEVLGSPALRLEVLVEGKRNAPVRWVATSELDDPTPFLEGGEVVLTTGLVVGMGRRGVDRLRRTTRQRGRHRSGVRHWTYPRGGTDAAGSGRSQGWPCLVRRAAEHAVRRVSRTIARLVQQEEQRALQSALAVQQQLTRAAVAPDGATAILDRLARIVRGQAMVCDRDATMLLRARSRDDTGASRYPLPASLFDLIDRLRPQGMRASHTDVGPLGAAMRRATHSSARRPGESSGWPSSRSTRWIRLCKVCR
jgi:purine catabolism regulator